LAFVFTVIGTGAAFALNGANILVGKGIKVQFIGKLA
jgi:hypothetical protein